LFEDPDFDGKPALIQDAEIDDEGVNLSKVKHLSSSTTNEPN